WRIVDDRIYKSVTADALVFGNNLFTEEQVKTAQGESAGTMASLQGAVGDIKKQIAATQAAQLAQIPEDPPKPELLSKKWGGSGSGEPTRTGVRAVGGA